MCFSTFTPKITVLGVTEWYTKKKEEFRYPNPSRVGIALFLEFSSKPERRATGNSTSGKSSKIDQA